MGVYVKVNSVFDAAGYMLPQSIIWSDWKTFRIDSVRDYRPARTVSGFSGDCYTVVIGGQERLLFFERVSPLFAGRVGRWFVEVSE